jgi:hypothetical protein
LKGDSIARPIALVHQHLPKLNPLGIVDVQDGNRGTTSLRLACKVSGNPLEVTFPGLASGIEQPDNFAGQGISTT